MMEADPMSVSSPEKPRFTRREVLVMSGLSAMAITLPGRATSAVDTTAAGLAQPLCYSSASQLARAIRAGQVTSEEVVTACLDRIKAVNPIINAVVQLDREGALSAARAADVAASRGEWMGPLHGVPMTIKDSLDTQGMVSTGGTLGRKDHVPGADATVVRRLREAGAILMGKTNTPELTLSFDTNNLVYGQTLNPYNTSLTPGGSSGGAAAIVAAGGSPFDIGSDYGGSIRYPAHINGICGIKPTSGRVPRTGHVYPFGGVQDSFQQLGPLARSVEDLALLLPLIMGPDGIDPYVPSLVWNSSNEQSAGTFKVAWFADNGIATPIPEIQRAVQLAVGALTSLGAEAAEARPEGIESTMEVTMPIYFWDGGAAVKRLLQDAGTVEHTLGGVFEAPALTADQLDAALTRLDTWRSGMLSFMSGYDALICPVNAATAFSAGAPLTEEMMANGSYTMAFNATGWPALVVPTGLSHEGMPIGVQVVAGAGREDLVLAAGFAIERALKGYRRPVLG
jgi:amidase